MNTLISNDAKTIAGYAIRTSNEAAAQTIPKAWEAFMANGVAERIQQKVSDDVYALYTDFENAGVNNSGEYTFLLGVEVSSTEGLPKDIEIAKIPSSRYHQIPVADNKPSNVFATWMDIWQRSDLDNSYVCDFEHYSANGEIAINVGTTDS